MLPLYHQNNNRPHLFNKQRNIVSALGWVFILWIASSITSIPGSSLKPCWFRTNCPPRGRPTHWQTALWLFWIFFIAPKLVIHGDQTWLILYQNCIIYNVLYPPWSKCCNCISQMKRGLVKVLKLHIGLVYRRALMQDPVKVLWPRDNVGPPLIGYCCASVVLLLLLLWYSSVVLLNRTPHCNSNRWAITTYY